MTQTNVIHIGNCAEVLRQYPDNFFDSVVTDPPYGLSKEPNISEVLTKWLAGEDYVHGGGGFMGKTWDSFVPGPNVWREVFRVLKPGGHVLAFAGTRTYDLMAIAIRIAGFEVRDMVEWLYLSGFPKSMDVGKAFDKREGAVREQLPNPLANKQTAAVRTNAYGDYAGANTISPNPVTPLAQQWDGWGTALKPAHEPIVMARKPLEKTVCYNVEKHGTGALNIDGTRIGDDVIKCGNAYAGNADGRYNWNNGTEREHEGNVHVGRFPANCVTLDDSEWYSPYFNVSGKDETNVSPRDISKKASKSDRNEDFAFGDIREIHGITNTHATVKPVALMAWLVRLVTPPNGVVLDPFAGSGTTCVAATREGMRFVGVELGEDHAQIAKARTGTLESSESNESAA